MKFQKWYILILPVIVIIVEIYFILVPQYTISMQVFYPSHPNLTITQSCTDFVTTTSGYLNGQPINLKNVTYCHLPFNMTQNFSEPFSCGIIGKNITCVNSIFGDGSEIWQGTILNVSNRG
jgi:hypothetical protein